MTSGHLQTWFGVERGEVEAIDFCGGTATHFSARCPTRVSSPNEDAACVVEVGEGTGLLAVADGVGGGNAGDKAARATIEHLTEHICRSDPEEQRTSLRGEILDAIERANRDILQWGIGSGATLAAVEYDQGRVRSYHVGDSKALLLSNRGRIKFATVGHAPVALAVEIGMLNEQEALTHHDLNLISNCLGSTSMKIEIGPSLRMAARDTLLVASDGLFDNLTSDEIATVIRTGNQQKKTDELARLALQRMNREGQDDHPCKPDDLTIICFRQGR
jgi:serine/threonine protein phosphatase PrpC